MKNVIKNSILALLLAGSASAQLATDNMVLRWDSAALAAVRALKFGPPMTARALAMLHTAMYDAWSAYDQNAIDTQIGGLLRRPASEWTLDNKKAAVSYAAYDVLLDLFPSQQAIFDAEMKLNGYNPDDRTSGITRPAAIGHFAAGVLLEFRHRDGSNQINGYADTTGYVPVNTADKINDPNRWQPLLIPDGHGGLTTQKFLVPHWGGIIPFALTSGDQFRPNVKLAQAGTAEYVDQSRELLSYSALLTDQQKMIAEYWADGPASETPPGHWCLFAQDVSRRDQHSLDDDVKMYFALTNAVFDASIAAWDAKRAYDSVRPITAIHYLYQGKTVLAWAGPNMGTMSIDGGTWQAYQAPTVVTPAFPEYVSGHSTFSAAAAEVLRSFTGSDLFGKSVTFRAGSSGFEAATSPKSDVTLSWSTFSDAADEAALSRRYGGIHYPQGDLDGRAIGRKVGANAWAKASLLMQGKTGLN